MQRNRTRVTRRTVVALLAAVSLIVGAAAPAAAATPVYSGTGWRQGAPGFVQVPCFFNGISYSYCTGLMNRIDYRNPGGSATNPPAVGQVFTVHVVVGVPAPDTKLISGFFHTQVVLPAGLKLAATTANPVRCIYSDIAHDLGGGKAPCVVHGTSGVIQIDSAHLVNHLQVHYFLPVVASKAFAGKATDDCRKTAVIKTGVCIQTKVDLPLIFLVTESVMVSAVPLTVRVKTKPTAPQTVAAASRSTAAVVSWKAPKSNGGSAITKYTATAAPGGRTCVTTTALSCKVTGLTNGVNYTFTVRATNAIGTSAASAASVAVKVGTPTPPRSPAVTHPAAGVAKITWSAPAYTGTGPVLRYEMRARATDGTTITPWSAWEKLGLTLSTRQSGLQAPLIYDIQLRAVNATGAGTPVAFAFLQSS